jgi:hypothetical protein
MAGVAEGKIVVATFGAAPVAGAGGAPLCTSSSSSSSIASSEASPNSTHHHVASAAHAKASAHATTSHASHATTHAAHATAHAAHATAHATHAAAHTTTHAAHAAAHAAHAAAAHATHAAAHATHAAASAAGKLELGDLTDAGEEWYSSYSDIPPVCRHDGLRHEVRAFRQGRNDRLITNRSTAEEGQPASPLLGLRRSAAAACRHRFHGSGIGDCGQLLGQYRPANRPLGDDVLGDFSVWERLETAAVRQRHRQEMLFGTQPDLPFERLLAVSALVDRHFRSDGVGSHLPPRAPDEDLVFPRKGGRGHIPFVMGDAVAAGRSVGQERAA